MQCNKLEYYWACFARFILYANRYPPFYVLFRRRTKLIFFWRWHNQNVFFWRKCCHEITASWGKGRGGIILQRGERAKLEGEYDWDWELSAESKELQSWSLGRCQARCLLIAVGNETLTNRGLQFENLFISRPFLLPQGLPEFSPLPWTSLLFETWQANLEHLIDVFLPQKVYSSGFIWCAFEVCVRMCAPPN